MTYSGDTPLHRLRRLGLELPRLAAPTGNFAPWRRSGNVVYVSGQVPLDNGEPRFLGRLGYDLDVAEGYKAAQLAALNAVAQLAAAADGDLCRVKGVLKLSGFVCATDAFVDHPKVLNGASDLLLALFGEEGRHARFAVGVNSLPRGVSVEVDLVAELTR